MLGYKRSQLDRLYNRVIDGRGGLPFRSGAQAASCKIVRSGTATEISNYHLGLDAT